jgi:hypothetical protein
VFQCRHRDRRVSVCLTNGKMTSAEQMRFRGRSMTSLPIADTTKDQGVAWMLMLWPTLSEHRQPYLFPLHVFHASSHTGQHTHHLGSCASRPGLHNKHKSRWPSQLSHGAVIPGDGAKFKPKRCPHKRNDRRHRELISPLRGAIAHHSYQPEAPQVQQNPTPSNATPQP